MENIQDGRCGKTCRAPCPLSMGRISAASSKASSASKTPRQMFLCRKTDAGCTRARSWATVILSPGASSTPRRVGASHKDGNVFLLSSILMDNVPERFSLSPKACQGMRYLFIALEKLESRKQVNLKNYGEKHMTIPVLKIRRLTSARFLSMVRLKSATTR